MTEKLALTMACGDYEIFRPLKEGTIAPDGIKLNILTRTDSATRHWRFLRNREYDVAECWGIDAIWVTLAFQTQPGVPFVGSSRFALV